MSRFVLIVFGSILLLLMYASCSKDPCKNFNYLVEVIDEKDDYVSAQAAYSQDSTNTNCIALMNAAQNYLNEAIALEECSRNDPFESQRLEAITHLELILDDLQC